VPKIKAEKSKEVRRMKSTTTKLVLGFGAIGYLVAVGLYFAPTRWHFPTMLVIVACPSALLSMASMTDPSFGAVALIIAPANAVIYGLFGFLVSGAFGGSRDAKPTR
jgi:hypothetical protein